MLIIEVQDSKLRGKASCGHNIPAGTSHFIIATNDILYSKCKSCIPKGKISHKIKAGEVVRFKW